MLPLVLYSDGRRSAAPRSQEAPRTRLGGRSQDDDLSYHVNREPLHHEPRCFVSQPQHQYRSSMIKERRQGLEARHARDRTLTCRIPGSRRRQGVYYSIYLDFSLVAISPTYRFVDVQVSRPQSPYFARHSDLVGESRNNPRLMIRHSERRSDPVPGQ